MLMPKKTKWRKDHKRRRGGKATRYLNISFGSYGLKSLTPSWVTSRQIESARRAMTRYVQRGGKIWIRLFPHKPMTKKGAEVPMGGGKGNVDHYVAVVKPGRILFELEGIPEIDAKEAFRKCGDKLPVKVKFVKKEI